MDLRSSFTNKKQLLESSQVWKTFTHYRRRNLSKNRKKYNDHGLLSITWSIERKNTGKVLKHEGTVSNMVEIFQSYKWKNPKKLLDVNVNRKTEKRNQLLTKWTKILWWLWIMDFWSKYKSVRFQNPKMWVLERMKSAQLLYHQIKHSKLT